MKKVSIQFASITFCLLNYCGMQASECSYNPVRLSNTRYDADQLVVESQNIEAILNEEIYRAGLDAAVATTDTEKSAFNNAISAIWDQKKRDAVKLKIVTNDYIANRIIRKDIDRENGMLVEKIENIDAVQKVFFQTIACCGLNLLFPIIKPVQEECLQRDYLKKEDDESSFASVEKINAKFCHHTSKAWSKIFSSCNQTIPRYKYSDNCTEIDTIGIELHRHVPGFQTIGGGCGGDEVEVLSKYPINCYLSFGYEKPVDHDNLDGMIKHTITKTQALKKSMNKNIKLEESLQAICKSRDIWALKALATTCVLGCAAWGVKKYFRR